MTKKPTDTVALSARPAWAVVMWVDDNWLYVELPVKDAAPYISKFSRTEGGLSKALAVMCNAHKKTGKRAYKSAKHTIVTRRTARYKDDFTPAQEETVADIIRRFKGPVH